MATAKLFRFLGASALATMVALAGCSDGKKKDTGGAGGTSGATGTAGTGGSSGSTGSDCGNGSLDTGEMCDGNNLDGETCSSITMGARPNGNLSCNSSCTFDESDCTGDGTGGGGGMGGMGMAGMAGMGGGPAAGGMGGSSGSGMGGTSGSSGMGGMGGMPSGASITIPSLTFTHTFNVDGCPQLIATIMITNNTSGPVDFVVSASDGTYVNFSSSSGSIPAMSSTTVDVEFNCGDCVTAGFTDTVTVEVSDSGGVIAMDMGQVNASFVGCP